MSIDRVATAQQNAFFLSQISQAGAKLDQTNQQIASGVVANTYAGFGDKAQVLQATLSAQARNTAYTAATNLASQGVMRRIGMVADPSRDFDHPRLTEDHPLRRHVVYTARR